MFRNVRSPRIAQNSRKGRQEPSRKVTHGCHLERCLMADRAVVDQLHQRDRAGCQGPEVVDFVWLGTEVERVALAVPGHRGQPQHECSGATISAGASLNKEEKKRRFFSVPERIELQIIDDGKRPIRLRRGRGGRFTRPLSSLPRPLPAPAGNLTRAACMGVKPSNCQTRPTYGSDGSVSASNCAT